MKGSEMKGIDYMATNTLQMFSSTTDWVAQHATDAGVRIVEVDVDTTAYDQGHVPGCGRLELDHRALRHARPRHRPGEEARGAARQERHRQQDDHRALRRQQQLVRRVGVLAVQGLRPQGRPHHERRAEEVARGRTRPDHRQADVPGGDLQGRRAGSVAARVPAGGAAGGRRQEGGARRRPQPAGVHRRDPRAARTARNLPARRPHPRREEHPLGQGLQRRWHVQELRRSEGALRRTRGSPATSRSSPTAASASARATPGSC